MRKISSVTDTADNKENLPKVMSLKVFHQQSLLLIFLIPGSVRWWAWLRALAASLSLEMMVS
jgi:hypothetical protein